MSIAEATRPAAPPSQPLAWPVVGGKRIAFGNSVGADEDARALQAIGIKTRFARNETLFYQGDPAQYGYKVISGVVRLCKHMADGRRHIAEFVFPGDFFCVFEPDLYSFTAEAVTNVVVMRYPQNELAALCDMKPTVRRRFHTLFSQQLCDLEDRLTVLGRQSAKERVVTFLLSMSERLGLEEDDLVDVPMTRQDIADYLGLTIETVCRVLSELKRSRLIKSPNLRQFVLSDPDKLQALADGETEFPPWERSRA